MNLVRHHLLEFILWPKEDGSFIEIRNSSARLKELGIYDDYKLCILLSRSEHAKLHSDPRQIAALHQRNVGSKRSTATRAKMSAAHKGHPCPKLAIEHSVAARKGKHWKEINGKRTYFP